MERIYEISEKPLVGIIMGSKSDLETMQETMAILDELQISYEANVVSAHRTPDKMFEYAELARERGIKVIVAGAGGAAHYLEWLQQKQPFQSLVFQFNPEH